jgi:lysophospholipase L1-like esterase
MDWYEPEVRALEHARAQHPPPPGPVVFYGSSSIRAWSTLAEDLGDRRAVNLGFGGSTLEACAHFFARLVPPLHPASLIVYAGDNDLGDGRRPEQVADAFRFLLAQAMRDLGSAPFGFLSIKPSPARAALFDRIRQTNDAIRQQIARHPTAFFIDVFEPMLDARGHVRPELFVEDGLHLGRAGYDLWAAVLRPFRDRIFTAQSPSFHTGVAGSKLDGSRIPYVGEPSSPA